MLSYSIEYDQHLNIITLQVILITFNYFLFYCNFLIILYFPKTEHLGRQSEIKINEIVPYYYG